METGAYSPTKTIAAMAAKRRGFTAFETKRVSIEPEMWLYESRPAGPGIEYARLFAEGKDYIHHVELTEELIPILVVTCFKNELPDDIPELFKIVPVTPSLFDVQREPRVKAPKVGPAQRIQPNVPAAVYNNVDPRDLARAMLLLDAMKPTAATPVVQASTRTTLSAAELAAQLFS